MKTKIILLLSLLIFPALCLAQGFPAFPMAFWGNATINGLQLPSGTKIDAFCDNDLVGEVTMSENGVYGYVESAKAKLLVGNCDGDILFKYLLSGAANPSTGGSEIKYTDSFNAGTTVNKNLAFIDSRTCSITNGTGSQTWSESGWGGCSVVNCSSGYYQSGNSCVANSIGGGGGGGGGGGNTTNTTTNAGDANGDGKVDKYDFALMMANWGRTGTNTCDFNNDGKVDKYDFALLMSKWGL